ncbi:hypothetical protein [Aquimarina sp. AU474]|uniref:hypothetical protein n=1 Tax=Aquimarina sp. AU474 TaxID=2108529 RepID=UPI000D6959B2|nr:hypothetical protein [Aquimarina sp. AU474]
MKKKKLSLQKIKVAKLNSLESIKGGGHTNQIECITKKPGCITDGEAMSGLECTWSVVGDCLVVLG